MQFTPISTKAARALQRGAPDANGQSPERRVSDGDGVPCRHCLKPVAKGAPYLVLAYRPFDSVQPYAEVGPIFLCADECAAGGTTDDLPPILGSPSYIVRGYNPDERIVYGTGKITPRNEIPGYCAELLARDDIAFVHVRSASNNCFQVRAER